MSAYQRLSWLHGKIAAGCYPNSSHMIERFGISQRQAQRDFDSLKKDFSAPLKYSSARRGYYYTEKFEMPIQNEELEADYIDIATDVEKNIRDSSDEIQLRIPYGVQLRIHDKLAVMDLRRFIVGKEPKTKDVYNCEFYNVDNFLGILFTTDADITVIKPEWLRDKVVEAAQKILKNNKSE